MGFGSAYYENTAQCFYSLSIAFSLHSEIQGPLSMACAQAGGFLSSCRMNIQLEDSNTAKECLSKALEGLTEVYSMQNAC